MNGSEGWSSKTELFDTSCAGSSMLIFVSSKQSQIQKKRLLWLGWQIHRVVNSRAREKCQNSMGFTIRICRHVFDVYQIHAGGEKPERQQHICNRHTQKKHSHTRGFAKKQKRDAHRGRQAKKQVNGTEGENAIFVF